MKRNRNKAEREAQARAARVRASGGGGPSNNTGWRDKKDEDELDFARRCAQMAKSKLGIKMKSRGFHR